MIIRSINSTSNYKEKQNKKNKKLHHESNYFQQHLEDQPKKTTRIRQTSHQTQSDK